MPKRKSSIDAGAAADEYVSDGGFVEDAPRGKKVKAEARKEVKGKGKKGGKEGGGGAKGEGRKGNGGAGEEVAGGGTVGRDGEVFWEVGWGVSFVCYWSWGVGGGRGGVQEGRSREGEGMEGGEAEEGKMAMCRE